jgi:hypothetical protein
MTVIAFPARRSERHTSCPWCFGRRVIFTNYGLVACPHCGPDGGANLTKPGNMTTQELRAYLSSPEYGARVAAILVRVKAGEVMSLQYIADQLGLPVPTFFGAVGAEFARMFPDAVVTIHDRPRVAH